MVRKECAFPKCRCKDGLIEATEAQEAFCSFLLQANHGYDGFKCIAGGA